MSGKPASGFIGSRLAKGFKNPAELNPTQKYLNQEYINRPNTTAMKFNNKGANSRPFTGVNQQFGGLSNP